MDKRDQPYKSDISFHDVERVIACQVKHVKLGKGGVYVRELMVRTRTGYQRIDLYADDQSALKIEELEATSDA